MEVQQLKNIVEAALLAAGRPLSLDDLQGLFEDAERPGRADLREVLVELVADYEERSIVLVEVASGWRIQVRSEYSNWLSRLWQERPPRYSRALLETLALVAYRQPITRGEIEDIRGVSVSSSIVRTLQERGWIRVVGHRDVPGKPEMFGTTKEFLDYFGLKRLDDLPSLAEIRDLDSINVELDFGVAPEAVDDTDAEPEQAEPGDPGAEEAAGHAAQTEVDEQPLADDAEESPGESEDAQAHNREAPAGREA